MSVPLLALQLYSPSEAITFHYSGAFWSDYAYRKAACIALSSFPVFGIDFKSRMSVWPSEKKILNSEYIKQAA